jgi:hypothetical protein
MLEEYVTEENVYLLYWEIDSLKELIDQMEIDNKKLKTELETAYRQMRLMNVMEQT